jgi:hypothetical protein
MDNFILKHIHIATKSGTRKRLCTLCWHKYYIITTWWHSFQVSVCSFCLFTSRLFKVVHFLLEAQPNFPVWIFSVGCWSNKKWKKKWNVCEQLHSFCAFDFRGFCGVAWLAFFLSSSSLLVFLFPLQCKIKYSVPSQNTPDLPAPQPAPWAGPRQWAEAGIWARRQTHHHLLHSQASTAHLS